MSSDYTPTTAQVRQLYANSMDPAGFDRWLAVYTAEKQAEALEQVLDGALLGQGDSGITVWDSREHFDAGLPRPLPIREWLRRRAQRLREQATNQSNGGQ